MNAKLSILQNAKESFDPYFAYTLSMKLQESALREIEGYKRKVLAYQAGCFAALAAGIVALLVLVVVPYATGDIHFSPLVKETGGSRLIAGGLIAVGLAVVLLAIFLPGYFRTRRYFAILTAPAGSYDSRALGRFLNALEGVAETAGVEAPYLAVLDGDIPNCMPLETASGPGVGITAGMLDADLTYPEVQAVMAHELSSLLSGDYLRMPGSFKFETAAYGLLAALALLSLISIAMVRPGHNSALTFGFAVLVWAYVLAAGFLIRRVRKVRGHDAVRADAVAAGITGKPEELENATTTMDTLVNKRKRYPFPASELGLDYMFAPPHNWSEKPRAYLERRARELDYDLTRRNVGRRVLALQQSMDELSERAAELLASRLENIRKIEEDRSSSGDQDRGD